MRKQFAKDKLIVLLGAGASCDAGMKNSFQMINEIENLLTNEWKRFKDLYNYIHSSHYHLERIKGTDLKEIYFNIENLVGLLDSIIKISNKDIDVYPFIGGWEKELYIVAGNQLDLAKDFKEKILTRLKDHWLSPDDFKSKSSYYKKLNETGYNYPLKIFSLNYDLCVESNLMGEGIILERGFNDKREWDYRRYEPGEEKEVNYFLYKLHGSLDWKRDNEKRLTFTDSPSSVNPLEMQIIFGVQNKLQSYDPYLFYFYAFREACIDAELIVTSGYGFLDQHINDNLISAFKLDPKKKLLVNIYDKDIDLKKKRQDLIEKLSIKSENLILENRRAMEFFETKLNLEYYASLFPEDEDTEPI